MPSACSYGRNRKNWQVANSTSKEGPSGIAGGLTRNKQAFTSRSLLNSLFFFSCVIVAFKIPRLPWLYLKVLASTDSFCNI
ncbi:hypothetical protein V6N13_146689 [Hibiscus sabdariffa]|uniref:Uncharacterized protein n=1 Tax=Hibiscus sabdariffa TaxID=183260 RepID=A0ABR2TTE3_9ROSI